MTETAIEFDIYSYVRWVMIIGSHVLFVAAVWTMLNCLRESWRIRSLKETEANLRAHIEKERAWREQTGKDMVAAAERVSRQAFRDVLNQEVDTAETTMDGRTITAVWVRGKRVPAYKPEGTNGPPPYTPAKDKPVSPPPPPPGVEFIENGYDEIGKPKKPEKPDIHMMREGEDPVWPPDPGNKVGGCD